MTVVPAPLVSIIIPVYKVEEYLDECLQSVCNQTYTNLEIILVDDGSPDRCGDICDRYAANDPRIKVIHKENGGLSDARNSGMQLSSGDYLFFVDSDDYIRPNTIDLVVTEAVNSNADLVCIGYESFIDGQHVSAKIDPPSQKQYFTNSSAVSHFVQYDWGAWGKLYKRAVHEGVLFPKGKIHEDEAIMFQILERCNHTVLLSDRLYLYRQRAGSITAQSYSRKQIDWFYAWVSNSIFIKGNYPNAYKHCVNKTWTVALYNIGNILGDSSFSREIQDIVTFARNFKMDIFFNNYVSIAQKIRLILLLISNPQKENCLYKRFYTTIDRIRGRR